MKMWSGRFRQALDPQFERWQRSFDFDRRLLSYELAASGAHARALKNAGVLSADELISILEGLQQIGEDGCKFAKDRSKTMRPRMCITSSRSSLWRGSARSATSCTAAAAATNRLLPICVFMCARRLISCERSWLKFAGLSPIAPNRRAARLCRLIRICSMLSRCWWRIGCWLMSKCFCAMQIGWPIAASV